MSPNHAKMNPLQRYVENETLVKHVEPGLQPGERHGPGQLDSLVAAQVCEVTQVMLTIYTLRARETHDGWGHWSVGRGRVR